MTIHEHLSSGTILVCEGNSGIPGREGLVLKVTKVGKTFAIGRVVTDPNERVKPGEGWRLTFPTTKRDIIEASPARIEYRIPRGDGWTVAYTIHDDSPCLCGSHDHEAEGITDCAAQERE